MLSLVDKYADISPDLPSWSMQRIFEVIAYFGPYTNIYEFDKVIFFVWFKDLGATGNSGGRDKTSPLVEKGRDSL